MRRTTGYGVAGAGVAVRGCRWSVMSTRLGRPTVAIVLSEEERETLERWARRPSTAQALALRSRIVLAAAARQANTEIAAALGCHPVTAGKWRRRFAQRRLDGLGDEPASRRAPHDQRRAGGSGDRQDAGTATAPRDPLVDPLDGRRAGHVADRDLQDLARLWPQAAPRRAVQAVARPAVHRQGARRGRPLSQPTRRGGRAVRGREDPDPGARPHGADAADAARRASPPDPRLRASRGHQSLRRAGCRLGPRDRRPDSATPGPRVPALPRPD